MPGAAEKIFNVALLFYATGAIMPFIVGEADPLKLAPMKPMELAIRAILYSVAFYFIAVRWRSVIEGAWNIKWIVALVMLAIASTAWSQDPSTTLRASASLLATTAFGVYFATRYTVPQQLRLLAWTCFLVVALSFFFVIFLPKYAIDPVMPHAWRGVFIQKNGLARVMVLALFVFLFVRPKRFQWLRWPAIAASLVLLFLSRSVTGMIVCAGIIATLPLYRLMRSRLTAAIPVICAGLLLGLVGLLLLQDVRAAQALQVVGRSPDLTGRIELWNAALGSISKRPWLGYGLDAFWRGMAGESGAIQLSAGWRAVQGHNGFIDLTLHLGALGLATFALGYLVVWRRALGYLRRVPGPLPVWLCTVLVFMLLYNLTENSLLAPHSIEWVLYTSTAVSLFAASFRQLGASPNGGSGSI